MIKGPSVDEIIRRLVLAHADGDMIGIACIFVNAQNQPEIEMSFGAGQAFTMNVGIDLLKDNIIETIKSKGQIEPKERE
jgi:hypothetical protein